MGTLRTVAAAERNLLWRERPRKKPECRRSACCVVIVGENSVGSRLRRKCGAESRIDTLHEPFVHLGGPLRLP